MAVVPVTVAPPRLALALARRLAIAGPLGKRSGDEYQGDAGDQSHQSHRTKNSLHQLAPFLAARRRSGAAYTRQREGSTRDLATKPYSSLSASGIYLTGAYRLRRMSRKPPPIAPSPTTTSVAIAAPVAGTREVVACLCPRTPSTDLAPAWPRTDGAPCAPPTRSALTSGPRPGGPK